MTNNTPAVEPQKLDYIEGSARISGGVRVEFSITTIGAGAQPDGQVHCWTTTPKSATIRQEQEADATLLAVRNALIAAGLIEGR